MNYGEILTDTVTLIWREKKLWVISALGIALFALANAFYTGGVMGWWQRVMMVVMTPEAVTEDAMGPLMMKMLYGYIALISFLGVFYLLGYVVDLVARGGGIAEAGRAWQGERVDISRGLGKGVRKSPAIFVIDLLWALPGLLVGIVGMGFAFVFLFGFIGSITQFENSEAGSRLLGMFGGFFAMLAILLCLGLLYSVLRGVFAPLMYQSAVLGDHPLGKAIGEGWRLSRDNLGPMILFWLLLLAVRLGLSVLFQMLALPFSLMLMGPWLRMMGAAGGVPGGGLPALNGVMLLIAGVGMGAIVWLSYSILQSIRVTLYARVYRELKKPAAPPVPATASPSAPE